MNKEKVTEWINEIIIDITTDEVSLESILRKTTVLAFQIKNDELKSWVKNEMDGYQNDLELPKYRILRAEIRGNLMQDLVGSVYSRPNVKLPVEVLPNKQAMEFARAKFNQSISAIESLLKGGNNDTIVMNLQYPEIKIVQKTIANYHIDSAWKDISKNQIYGLIATIKNRLLTFLLDLNDEIGNYENLTIMKKSNITDKLFEKNIKAKHLNVSIGNNNTISANISKTYQIDEGLREDLEQIIDAFKEIQNNINSEEYTQEIEALEVELKKKKPGKKRILSPLSNIKTMLINIASNASTKPVVSTVEELIKRLSE